MLREDITTTNLSANEYTLEMNVNFGGFGGYHVMPSVDNYQIQCVGLDYLPYDMRGILQLDKLGFSHIRF